jgi:hypothetical protein
LWVILACWIRIGNIALHSICGELKHRVDYSVRNPLTHFENEVIELRNDKGVIIPGGHIVDEECSVVRQENALPVDCRVFALNEDRNLRVLIIR